MLKSFLIALLCAGLAALTAVFLNPLIVYVAYKKNILDKPNFRKLQRRPVPVLGGMSVYMAMLIGMAAGNFFYPAGELFIAFVAISIMFYVGLLDDIIGLSAVSKFIFQIAVISFLWFFGYRLDNLHGLLGIYQLPQWGSYLLSVIAGVGLLNALNMIDGVDGLASGLGIFTSTLCGLFFVRHGNPLMALVAVVVVGSLIPFFICNVFSHKYKMFIGDSGSLIIGTVAYLFCCEMLKAKTYYPLDNYLISMLLTIYAIPVFDTLRVMGVRIFHKTSPFKADKKHLHHIFVALGMPHFVITFIILLLAVAILVVNYLFTWCRWSPSWHLLVTLLVDILFVWGAYIILRYIELHHPNTFFRLRAHSRLRMAKPIRYYNAFQSYLDGKLMRRFRKRKHD